MSGIPSRQQATDLFNRIDCDGNNTITPREFADFVKSEHNADFFLNLDKNNDRKITLEELLEEVMKEPRAQAIDAAFQEIDSDSSGAIQKCEVLEHGPKAGLTDTNTLDKCFAEMDKDGSGQVDKGEFIAYMNQYY
ncbi:hypothetical protein ACF0H5_015518 [Mactra antiquata]